MQLQRDVDMKMLNTRKAPVWWSGWLLALTFVAFAGGQVHAWEVRDTLAAEEERLLKNPAFDVLVVTVLAVEETGATNGNPPGVELGVEEFLRGGDRTATVTTPNRIIDGIPRRHGFDFGPYTGGRRVQPPARFSGEARSGAFAPAPAPG